MNYKYALLIIPALLLVSCAATKDNLNITESYSLVYSSFQLAKDAHQKLSEKYSGYLHAIKNDANANIDTRELYILLDSAKSANQKSSAMLDLAGEINTVKYKDKAFRYISLLDKLYNNELKKYIIVLASQSNDRYEKAQKLLLSRQVELERLDKRFLYAADEVRIRYQLQITDSSQMTK